MKIEKAPNMDFKLLIAISILIPSFIGSAAAQSMAEQQDFTQDEIIEMANKAVVIVTQSGTFTIELFPEVAPNHVYHFLKLIESGYYDGTVFHRIIPQIVENLNIFGKKVVGLRIKLRAKLPVRQFISSGGPGEKVSDDSISVIYLFLD